MRHDIRLFLSKLLFCLLFSSPRLPSFAQSTPDPLQPLPSGGVFAPLIGDPDAPLLGLTAYSHGDYEASVGLSKDLLAFQPDGSLRLAWGAFAGAKCLEEGDLFSLSGSQQSVDWQAGTYLSGASGAFCHQLRWTHLISYLGDGPLAPRNPITYTRDRVSLASSFNPWSGVRVYGRLGLKLWWDDLRLGGSQSSLALGLELHHPLGRLGDTALEGYATYQWEYKDDGPGFIDQEAQLGLLWKRKGAPDIRTALLYYNGHSPFGQFWMEKDEHLAFGLYLDL